MQSQREKPKSQILKVDLKIPDIHPHPLVSFSDLRLHLERIFSSKTVQARYGLADRLRVPIPTQLWGELSNSFSLHLKRNGKWEETSVRSGRSSTSRPFEHVSRELPELWRSPRSALLFSHVNGLSHHFTAGISVGTINGGVGVEERFSVPGAAFSRCKVKQFMT